MQQDSFESYRPLLFSIAYRMLGSAMEAEDIVQEAYLRYQATPPEKIRSLKSFLTTIVNNLCLDELKSARAQRETYIGPWLPEPVYTGDGAWLHTAPRPVREMESLSMAFLVLLESLTPLERAVFILRDVFDYDYAEIAQIIGKEEATCRQLFSRAKKHLSEHRPRFPASPEAHARMFGRFMEAIQVGELDGLMSLLTEDVTVWSDGGGKATAARRPIGGRENVARFFRGLFRRKPDNASAEVAEINGKSALLVRVEGSIRSVFTFEMDGDKIQSFRVVVNPDKLASLNSTLTETREGKRST